MDNDDIKSCDESTLQIIYEEILDQWKGNFRTFQTLRERLGQIIAFIGIILNLELLAIIQLFSTNSSMKYIGLLVLSSLFIIVSLITAAYAYRTAPFKGIKTSICLESYRTKTKNELVDDINKKRLEDIEKNKKILHIKATWTHLSLNTLVLGILLIASFIILNIVKSLDTTIISILIVIIVVLSCYLYENKEFSKKLN